MRFSLFRARMTRGRAARRAAQARRRAGLRTLTRRLGTAGLPAETEAWVIEVEEALRQAEPRILDDLRP